MEQRLMVWPIGNTGEWLARELLQARFRSNGVLNGTNSDIVNNYLRWVSDEVRMFQRALEPSDLNRLFTTPRYWATLANPIGVLTGVQAITHEVEHQQALLEATSAEVEALHKALKPHDPGYTNYVVADTNFWVERNESFTKIDWMAILNGDGPGYPNTGDEVRIIVPMIVIDELDGLGHRREMRPKVSGVTNYLFQLLGDTPWQPHEIRPRGGGQGEVTIQVLFDSLLHVRLPNNDDEIIDRLRAVRDFVGSPARNCFFITNDKGAAFRATAAAHMTRLLPK